MQEGRVGTAAALQHFEIYGDLGVTLRLVFLRLTAKSGGELIAGKGRRGPSDQAYSSRKASALRAVALALTFAGYLGFVVRGFVFWGWGIRLIIIPKIIPLKRFLNIILTIIF